MIKFNKLNIGFKFGSLHFFVNLNQHLNILRRNSRNCYWPEVVKLGVFLKERKMRILHTCQVYQSNKSSQVATKQKERSRMQSEKERDEQRKVIGKETMGWGGGRKMGGNKRHDIMISEILRNKICLQCSFHNFPH